MRGETRITSILTSSPRGQHANKIGVQVIDDVARFLGVAEKKVEPATDTKTKQAAAEPVAKKPDDPVKPEPPAKTETAATGTPAAGVAAAGEKPAVPAVKPMTSGPTPGEPWPIKGDVRTRTVTEKEPVEDGFPRPKK